MNPSWGFNAQVPQVHLICPPRDVSTKSSLSFLFDGSSWMTISCFARVHFLAFIDCWSTTGEYVLVLHCRTVGTVPYPCVLILTNWLMAVDGAGGIGKPGGFYAPGTCTHFLPSLLPVCSQCFINLRRNRPTCEIDSALANRSGSTVPYRISLYYNGVFQFQ